MGFAPPVRAGEVCPHSPHGVGDGGLSTVLQAEHWSITAEEEFIHAFLHLQGRGAVF